MQHERRRYPRVQRRIRLQLHKKRLAFLRGASNAAEIADVSRGGARIKTQVDIGEGDKVVLVFTNKTLEAPLEFGGRVVWVKPVRGTPGHYNLIGVRFEALSAEMSSRLFRFAVGQMEE